jgi:protein phosphatase
MIQCPNHTCQTLNPETHRFCQTCGIFLPKRYLWAIGHGSDQYRPGDMLASRYLCKAPRVFLDTQPAIDPDPFQEFPPECLPYLKLAPYRLNIPQLYEVVGLEGSSSILLMDGAPLAIASLTEVSDTIPDLRNGPSPSQPTIRLQPSLHQAWPSAIALRQLNWLWQLAQLWQPLQLQSVSQTLLTPNLLKVEGGIIRVLELCPDPATPPSLVDLGKHWQQWIPDTHASIKPFVQKLCQQLIKSKIHNPDQLVEALDRAIAHAGPSVKQQIVLCAQTDQGPHRKRNEDACFPSTGSVQRYTLEAKTADSEFPLLVVCDGIGGHQGGDVASGLAIATIQKEMAQVDPNDLDPVTLSLSLEDIASTANAVINQRNNDEQRHDRERMGTTLVMGLLRRPELYITHVGDSRAYWITRHGYHQVTLDDDIASREVRMGYSSFRQALQQPISGSLVQALGMGPSNMLHPTVQRFILDEDCVFLLCSDGLSDFDRVDEYWDSTLLPILQGKLSPEQVTKELVNIANTRNGHDNVTIGLLYCQVQPEQMPPIPANLAIVPDHPREQSSSTLLQRSTTISSATAVQAAPTPTASSAASDTLDIASVPSPDGDNVKPAEDLNSSSSTNFPALIFSILLLVLAGGGLAYLIFNPGPVGEWISGLLPDRAELTEPSPTNSPGTVPDLEEDAEDATDTSTTVTSLDSLAEQSVIRLTSSPDNLETLTLWRDRPNDLNQGSTDDRDRNSPTADPGNQGMLQAGSVLYVQSLEPSPSGDRWVQVKVCSTPGDDVEATADSRPESDRLGPPNPSDTDVGGESLPSASDTPSGLVATGREGWISEAILLEFVVLVDEPTLEQLGDCPSPADRPRSSDTDNTASPSGTSTN